MTKHVSIDAVLIAGPTASGKSAAAAAIAAAIGGAVVNADSMQVYRELEVLTARPGAAELARAPHRLYGHVPVAEAYSVGRYAQDAAATLTELRQAGVTPVFCGGTGLYFAALTQGLADIPPVPEAVRAAVRAMREGMGPEAFHAALVARDPASAALNPGDTQRTLRAMEVLAASGQPLSYWQQRPAAPVLAGLKLARIVIAPPRPTLYARIDMRFAAMLESGAVDEAKRLADLDPALPAAKALGLKPLVALLRGAIGEAEAIAAAQQASRNYAKRQLTWFRQRMADWQWLDHSRNVIPEIIQICT